MIFFADDLVTGGVYKYVSFGDFLGVLKDRRFDLWGECDFRVFTGDGGLASGCRSLTSIDKNIINFNTYKYK